MAAMEADPPGSVQKAEKKRQKFSASKMKLKISYSIFARAAKKSNIGQKKHG